MLYHPLPERAFDRHEVEVSGVGEARDVASSPRLNNCRIGSI
jgi:hypothetical protein